MRYYDSKVSRLRFASPSTKLLVLGVISLCIMIILEIGIRSLSEVAETIPFFKLLKGIFQAGRFVLFTVVIITIILSIIICKTLSDASNIRIMVRRGLFSYENGNPLRLKDGELLPAVRCKEIGVGLYELTITAVSCTVEDIQKISSSISSSLNKRYNKYAVTQTDTDIAFNEVRFRLEDVTVDRSLKVKNVEELRPDKPTKLIIQQGTYIDLTTSGSMIIAGKTRSGKSTAAVALLSGALLAGRDEFGSEVMIIDPKQAELSRLPHVYTLDGNGEAREILAAIQKFADMVVQRQKILNDLSEQKGDAVHWWDAGFHVSLLFIDEYVSARTMFPKRAGKDDADYCLAAFDDLIKRIITMGASTGSYAMISIAEASVDEGGLPAMIRSACSTKILFKPTLTEGRFLWDGDKLKDFPERVYNAGDAWFSSTDGIHDSVSYVHFPYLDYPVYRELGRLLGEYYAM